MTNKLHIGIPAIGTKDWLGGISYIEFLIKAINTLVERERPKLFLIASDHMLTNFDLHDYLLPMVDGLIVLGNDSRKSIYIQNDSFIRYIPYHELPDVIDFYYPATSMVMKNICSGSWIPDFQHIHLPEFFTRKELSERDNMFKNIAEQAKLVVFSSLDAENDFRNLFPSSVAQRCVLSFHSLQIDSWYSLNASDIRHKYFLPDKFLICCNQFWAHKNHRLLFQALSGILKSGIDMHIVCTGSTADYRNTDYFADLQQLINRLGIEDNIHILGIVPRSDQLQLIRCSMAVLQPSLFEGWSTVVEDSRALGKTIILSDLAVHREQAPDYAFYFQRSDVNDLMRKIKQLLPTLTPGPNLAREQRAKEKNSKLVQAFAQRFCSIAQEAQSMFGTKHLHSLIERGESLHRQGDKAGAERLFLLAINFDIDAHIAHNNLAIMYWQSGDRQEAMDQLTLSLQKEPSYKPAVINYIEILKQSGHTGKALSLCTDYLKYENDQEIMRIADSISAPIPEISS